MNILIILFLLSLGSVESLHFSRFSPSLRHLRHCYSTAWHIYNLIKIHFRAKAIACVIVPHWGSQRLALKHQMPDADVQGPRRPPGLLNGCWCAGCVWESPGLHRWLWLAALLSASLPSDEWAKPASGGGNRLRTCRLQWTPSSKSKSLSVNTNKRKILYIKHEESVVTSTLITFHEAPFTLSC